MTVRDAVRNISWYLKEVAGESDYDRWVAYRREHHPGDPVMSRRDYECRRMDDRDSNPRARCC